MIKSSGAQVFFFFDIWANKTSPRKKDKRPQWLSVENGMDWMNQMLCEKLATRTEPRTTASIAGDVLHLKCSLNGVWRNIYSEWFWTCSRYDTVAFSTFLEIISMKESPPEFGNQSQLHATEGGEGYAISSNRFFVRCQSKLWCNQQG